MLFAVYDAVGQMFEVRPHVAKRLVIAEGWSMEPPKAAPVVAPVLDTVKSAPPPVDYNV